MAYRYMIYFGHSEGRERVRHCHTALEVREQVRELEAEDYLVRAIECQERAIDDRVVYNSATGLDLLPLSTRTRLARLSPLAEV